MNKKNILKYVKWLWLVVVFVVVGFYFYNHFHQIEDQLKTVQPIKLFFSLIFILVAKFFVIELARQSVKHGNWLPKYYEFIPIVALSQLGKYIPGGIWHFAARISSYKENELSNKDTGKAMLVENIWLVTGATIFGLIALSIFPPTQVLEKLHIALPTLFFQILPIVLMVFWAAGLILLNRIFPDKMQQFSILQLIYLIFIQIAIWASLGISFYFICQIPVASSFPVVIGGYAISWIAGYLVIFAPGGIGIRELVLVALFSVYLPTDQVVTFSVIHRLIYTFAEILLGLLGLLIQWVVNRSRKKNETPA